MRRRCPRFLGVRAFEDYPLEELVPYIDWMPFFNAWEFAGKFPDILQRSGRGRSGQRLCMRMPRACSNSDRGEVAARRRAVVGFFPANSGGDDDIDVFTDEIARSAAKLRLHHLRQQKSKPQNQAQSAWRISSRRRRAAAPTTSGPSR